MSVDKDVWCCTLFKASAQRRGQNDIAIAIENDRRAGLMFWLEFRLVAQKDEDAIAITCPFPVRLAMRQGINFCPWCGRSLRQFYAGRVEHLPISASTLEEATGGEPTGTL
jgi:hypothetical protein